jgi:biotin transporter BioY
MIARCLAGALLGFPLAAVVLSLLLHALPDRGDAYVIPALILFFPLWIAFMIGAFALRSGPRAWLTLGTANAVGFFALWLARHAAGI